MLFICVVGSSSCGEAITKYYEYNIDLQQWTNKKQYEIEQAVGKENIAVVGSMVGVMALKKGKINMQRHLNLILDTNSALFQLHWEN